jgi:hypothetical protein
MSVWSKGKTNNTPSCRRSRGTGSIDSRCIICNAISDRTEIRMCNVENACACYTKIMYYPQSG